MKSGIRAVFLYSVPIIVLAVCGAIICAQSPARSKVETLRVEDILQAFRTARLPIDNDIIYNDENDPNKLLGRPHQYVAKANWADKRIEQSASGDLKGGTVEAFENQDSLERRRRYVDQVGKAVPMLVQYQFVHKNILLRLDKELTPRQAGEYERVLKQL